MDFLATFFKFDGIFAENNHFWRQKKLTQIELALLGCCFVEFSLIILFIFFINLDLLQIFLKHVWKE